MSHQCERCGRPVETRILRPSRERWCYRCRQSAAGHLRRRGLPRGPEEVAAWLTATPYDPTRAQRGAGRPRGRCHLRIEGVLESLGDLEVDAPGAVVLCGNRRAVLPLTREQVKMLADGLFRPVRLVLECERGRRTVVEAASADG